MEKIPRNFHHKLRCVDMTYSLEFPCSIKSCLWRCIRTIEVNVTFYYNTSYLKCLQYRQSKISLHNENLSHILKKEFLLFVSHCCVREKYEQKTMKSWWKNLWVQKLERRRRILKFLIKERTVPLAYFAFMLMIHCHSRHVLFVIIKQFCTRVKWRNSYHENVKICLMKRKFSSAVTGFLDMFDLVMFVLIECDN